ncbi:MAG: dihydrofolate reductase family protein [Anaerolineae bacterium]|nr:dihydrofolate reductase family protein [Anaerolineae bacterium]
MTWNWDDALKEYVDSITHPVDCILLGRKLAEGFIPYWAAVAANPDDPEFSAGVKFTETPKIVFTRTLKQPQWENSVLATGDLVEEVNRLKNSPGGDLIVYGGAEFVAELIRCALIDEYHCFVNPVAIGQGKTIFNRLEDKQDLKLVKTQKFECGIMLLKYILK